MHSTIIYHYDPDTLLYGGSGAAHVGPAGDVQLPAFSTLVAPGDIPAGKVARAVAIVDGHATAWMVIDDYRDRSAYRVSDGSRYRLGDEFGTGQRWAGVGAVPRGLTLLVPPQGHVVWDGAKWIFDLGAARAAALAAVDAKSTELLHSPFTHDGVQFAGDAVSLQRLLSAVSLASIKKLAGKAWSVEWPAADGAVVELDADGVLALGEAASERMTQVLKTARQLKDQIAAGNDEAAVSAAVWPQQHT